jgi:hypothetical protein
MKDERKSKQFDLEERLVDLGVTRADIVESLQYENRQSHRRSTHSLRNNEVNQRISIVKSVSTAQENKTKKFFTFSLRNFLFDIQNSLFSFHHH